MADKVTFSWDGIKLDFDSKKWYSVLEGYKLANKKPKPKQAKSPPNVLSSLILAQIQSFLSIVNVF